MKKFMDTGKIILVVMLLFTLGGCSKENTASSVVEKSHVDAQIDKSDVSTSVYEKTLNEQVEQEPQNPLFSYELDKSYHLYVVNDLIHPAYENVLIMKKTNDKIKKVGEFGFESNENDTKDSEIYKVSKIAVEQSKQNDEMYIYVFREGQVYKGMDIFILKNHKIEKKWIYRKKHNPNVMFGHIRYKDLLDQQRSYIYDVSNETDKKDEFEKINNTKELQDAKIVDDPIYIAIDDLFLGTFEDGQWNSNQLKSEYDSNKIKGMDGISSVRDITIEEINQKQTYYLYSMTDKIVKTNKFLCYAPDESITSGTFYNLSYDFYVNNEKIKDTALGVTHDYNPIPKKLRMDVAVTKRHTLAIRKILDANGLNDTKVNITKVTSADIDDDGVEEELILAGTPNDEEYCPKINAEDRFKDGAGVYITAVILKKDKVIPIYYEGRKLKDLDYREDFSELPFGIDSCIGLYYLGIFDLNNDGKYEVCLENISWDCPEIRVYEWQKDNTMKEVLYGDFSW